jgi:hypothetical protein
MVLAESTDLLQYFLNLTYEILLILIFIITWKKLLQADYITFCHIRYSIIFYILLIALEKSFLIVFFLFLLLFLTLIKEPEMLQVKLCLEFLLVPLICGYLYFYNIPINFDILFSLLLLYYVYYFFEVNFEVNFEYKFFNLEFFFTLLLGLIIVLFFSIVFFSRLILERVTLNITFDWNSNLYYFCIFVIILQVLSLIIPYIIPYIYGFFKNRKIKINEASFRALDDSVVNNVNIILSYNVIRELAQKGAYNFIIYSNYLVYFYFLFFFFPTVIVILSFFYDICINNKLYYFNNVIIILFIPLFYKVIIQIIKYWCQTSYLYIKTCIIFEEDKPYFNIEDLTFKSNPYFSEKYLLNNLKLILTFSDTYMLYKENIKKFNIFFNIFKCLFLFTWCYVLYKLSCQEISTMFFYFFCQLKKNSTIQKRTYFIKVYLNPNNNHLSKQLLEIATKGRPIFLYSENGHSYFICTETSKYLKPIINNNLFSVPLIDPRNKDQLIYNNKTDNYYLYNTNDVYEQVRFGCFHSQIFKLGLQEFNHLKRLQSDALNLPPISPILTEYLNTLKYSDIKLTDLAKSDQPKYFLINKSDALSENLKNLATKLPENNFVVSKNNLPIEQNNILKSNLTEKKTLKINLPMEPEIKNKFIFDEEKMTFFLNRKPGLITFKADLFPQSSEIISEIT